MPTVLPKVEWMHLNCIVGRVNKILVLVYCIKLNIKEGYSVTVLVVEPVQSGRQEWFMDLQPFYNFFVIFVNMDFLKCRDAFL